MCATAMLAPTTLADANAAWPFGEEKTAETLAAEAAEAALIKERKLELQRQMMLVRQQRIAAENERQNEEYGRIMALAKEKGFGSTVMPKAPAAPPSGASVVSPAPAEGEGAAEGGGSGGPLAEGVSE